DPDLQRPLAVKLLLRHAAGKTGAIDRFLEEARLTGQLQHPGIPPIHELGRLDDGRPFFAMKLIRGQTLAALLMERKVQEPPMPPGSNPSAGGDGPAMASRGIGYLRTRGCVDFVAPPFDPRLLAIFRQVCQTIAYVHSRDIIHRDLKPLNVMVGAFGEVQVM